MKYFLSVHSDKDERVLRLLESLEELGVIESFTLFEESADQLMLPGGNLLSREVQEFDIADQYRNLVD